MYFLASTKGVKIDNDTIMSIVLIVWYVFLFDFDFFIHDVIGDWLVRMVFSGR